HWGPRNIDIDILLYGELVIQDEELTVPHPRMTERAFVLRPLADIAPRVRHPETKKDIRTTLADIQAKSGDKNRH
ncbi:MAG TPA: 2-amino-4-hydroxy-6-hydroxymethyldihydropteridine diphosphokinase, partial [Planctomycetota bacterium]|nr:2-amino-4-hydroxy-6-hydroxymethyldihydropteridine diphosphokinase [Planctomycetota bacterium]